jgi:hypothetical protein
MEIIGVIFIVLRFTKEEILALRKPTKIIPDFPDIPAIMSVKPLMPECLQPFDTDDVRYFLLIDMDCL